MIPNIVHFVYGLAEQTEPFAFLHYAAVEAARRVLEPDAIYFHRLHEPWGEWWERTAPGLIMVDVEPTAEVLGADYSTGQVPPEYLYAHHADFVRLDALIEHGGVYCDIDNVFVRRPPPELWRAPFVIGREQDVPDPTTGALRPSLCNAVMMAEPGSRFAREWRDRMPGALDGTWSNHSGFLAWQLSQEIPEAVRVEPEPVFFPFSYDGRGLSRLFLRHEPIPQETVSVHLWAHMWWSARRKDFPAHDEWTTPSGLRRAHSTVAELLRPYLPPLRPSAPRPWIYLSLDNPSGYGTAASRCRHALESAGQPIDWVPCLPAPDGHFRPPPALNPLSTAGADDVVIAHLVPELYPSIRRAAPDSYLVAYTAWETTALPLRWREHLENADLVLVPSRFNSEIVRDAGLEVPVEVVPHIASDPDAPFLLRPEWEKAAAGRFVFYAIGDWIERKGLHLTVEAFLRAFSSSDDVVLIVKTSPDDRRIRYGPPTLRPGTAGSTAAALARLLSGQPDPPPVLLVTRELDDAEVAGLHHLGDCFVSLTRGEGWGVGTFDAAAYGKPVITTGFGGQLDYLDPASPLIVGHRLVPVHDPVHASYTPDQLWAEPDIDHAVVLMRDVVNHPNAARERARARAGLIRDRFAAPRVAETMRAVIGMRAR